MKQIIRTHYFWVTAFDDNSLILLVKKAMECDFLEEDIERMLASKTVDLLDDTFEALGLTLVEKDNKTVIISDDMN